MIGSRRQPPVHLQWKNLQQLDEAFRTLEDAWNVIQPSATITQPPSRLEIDLYCKKEEEAEFIMSPGRLNQLNQTRRRLCAM